jgi:ATP-dependent RNA helicase DOB1
MQPSKRAAAETDDADDADAEPDSKHPRLADETLSDLPGGCNIIEIDGKSCTHEVVWPSGSGGSPLPPPKSKESPKDYPFTLDPFQRTAINCLEAGKGLGVPRLYHIH